MKHLIHKFLFCAILIVCSATSALSELDVQINTSAEEITVSDFINLEISVTDNSPNSSPFELKFYTNNNFTIRQSGKFSKISIINGVTNSTVIYKYTFAPDANLTPGSYKLPQAYLDFGHGNVQNLKDINVSIVNTPKTPSKSANPMQAAGGNNSPTANAASNPIDFTQTLSTLTPYLGQQVSHKVQIKARVPIVHTTISEANFPKMWFQSLGEAKESIVSEGNSTVRVISSDTALYPLENGEITIPARTIEVEVQSRAQKGGSLISVDDDIFSIFGGGILSPTFGKLTETKRFVAPAMTLKVKSLPTPPFAQTYIPVGDVQINTALDKQEISEGESLTLKITLTGDAHLGLFDLPEIQDNTDFKIYPEAPISRSRLSDGKLIQEKTFNFAMVPQKSDKLLLPTFKILTFNPKTEKYNVLNSQRVQIKVNPTQNLNNSDFATNTEQPRQDTTTDVSTEDGSILQTPLSIEQILASGKETLSATPRWIWFTVGLIVIVLPGSFFILKSIQQKRLILANNPHLARQLNAYNVAMRSLNQLFKDENFDKLTPILLRYLGDKFMVVGESLTAKEAENLVLQNLHNLQLATKVREVINNLESQKYGQTDLNKPANTMSAILRIGEGKKDVIAIIQEIEGIN